MTRELLVTEPGPMTTVQDPGRRGLAHLGVPRSGWLDPDAATRANRLVGNPDDSAVLECVLGGLTFTVGAAMAVAVTGAPLEVRVDGRAVSWGAAVSVRAGSAVSLGVAVRGLRGYVAVAGGLDVAPVLGSRATDTLSGLGPSVVGAGDVLPVAPACGPPSYAEDVAGLESGTVTLRCVPGPRVDWFTSSALETLARAPYRVAADSDRVGLRLAGAALVRARPEELPSEGLVRGAVQVPADGQPLVFLNDHPTTGGYPVVAVVDPTDVGRCAQLRPGDEVSFRPGRPRVWGVRRGRGPRR
jgi:biotin-dependent carboxylase-like uncharacterized protein